MKLKTYQARSVADALAKVKKDLGKDAVILHTRTLTRGGVLGIGARSVVEITATNDSRVMTFRRAAAESRNADGRPAPRGSLSRAAEYESGGSGSGFLSTDERFGRVRGRGSPVLDEGEARGVESDAGATSALAAAAAMDARHGGTIDARRAAAVGAGAPPAAASDESAQLRRELSEIRGMVHDLVQRARQTEAAGAIEEYAEYHAELLARDVQADIASEIMSRLADRIRSTSESAAPSSARLDGREAASDDDIRLELRRIIAELLPPAWPLKLRGDANPTVVALVGPTGVGKTTTIAKLAANMKLRENKQVGLITIDSYRIAAVEQLKTYAQILRIPIMTVLKPAEVRNAIERMADLDLILIDTAGRSQKDGLRIAELNEFIRAANPDQLHTVLSTTSKPGTIREAIERFGVLGGKHLLFTKLDEAESAGEILNVLREHPDLRLSYLTTGQAVPDDIEIGSASRVAHLILGDSHSASRVMEPGGVSREGSIGAIG